MNTQKDNTSEGSIFEDLAEPKAIALFICLGILFFAVKNFASSFYGKCHQNPGSKESNDSFPFVHFERLNQEENSEDKVDDL